MAAERSGLLAPIAERWEAAARDRGRPTIAMALFVRLMVVKQRTGWGYETLVREVSDSLHLRRFCGLSLTASVPHESTIRKLVRRLGPEVVEEITRAVDRQGAARAALHARAMRVRLDGRRGRRALALGRRAGAGRGAAAGARGRTSRPRRRRRPARAGPLARGRPAAAADRPHRRAALGRPAAPREGARAHRPDRRAGRVARSARHAGWPPRRAGGRGRGASAKLAAAGGSRSRPSWPRRSAAQIRQRLAGEKITDRLVSLADPDARRSARASSASATSSATSSSSPSSPRTPAAARAA